MDFGSFLRERRLKQQGAANINPGLGSQQNAHREAWNLDRPYQGMDEFFGANNQGMASGASSWSNTNRNLYEGDFYEQDQDCFSGGAPMRYDDYENNQAPFGQESYRDYYNDPVSDEQGMNNFPRRGRVDNQRMLPTNRGRGSSAFERGRDAGSVSERGFGRGSQRGRQQNFGPTCGVELEDQMYPGENTADIGNFGHDKAMNEKTDCINSETVHDLKSDKKEFQSYKKSVEYDDGLLGERQKTACDDHNEVKQSLEKTEKKREIKEVNRNDDDQKTLAEFDIMQVNINWAHFGITNKMLREASAEGKQVLSQKKNYDVAKLEFYCKLCDVQTVSGGNFHAHLNGKRHVVKAENEIENVDTAETETDPQTYTYGEVAGMPNPENVSVEDKEPNKKEQVEYKPDLEYEKKFYEEFDISKVEMEWALFDITDDMLKEASIETREVNFEDKCCDVFHLRFYCKLCDVQSTSGYSFWTHLTGKKHINKYARVMKRDTEKQTKVDEPKEVEEENENDNDKEILDAFDITKVNLKWDHYGITEDMLQEASIDGVSGTCQRKRKKKEYDINRLEFYCKLCASQMVSAGNFYDHLVGKKHKSNYQDYLKFTSVTGTREPLPIEIEKLGKQSVFDAILSKHRKGALGLSYITELHSIYDLWCVCHLCGCKFRGSVCYNHVFGYKHRTLYMRDKHPDVYQEIKTIVDKGTSPYGFLDTVSREKEEEDGRGKALIKRYDETLEEDVELATQNIPFEDSQRFKDHFKRVSDFSNWVKAELSVAFTKFTQLFNGRPASPVLNYTRKRIDKDEERRPEFVEHPAGPSYNIYHHHSREDPLLRHPPGRGISPPPHVRRALLHFPPHPHKEPPFPLFPPSPFDPYENPLRRSLPNERDPYLRGLSNERDPYLRGLSNERDPYLRGLSNERDPYLDLRNPPRMPDPYLEADLYRSRLPDRHARPEQYLDPDPLKRVFKPKPPVEPKPLKPVRPSEPFIDPDPLKRVLPSQKAKQAKPVVIDYSHGKVEKSAENKAKEWEDDIKDLLDSSKSKSHDSLSLLNSSYSSPKRENSPPEVKPTRELPFAKSYLDRAFSKAKEKSPVRKDKKRSGSYIRKKGSRSPEHYKYKKEPSGLDSYRKKISDYSFLDKKQRMSPSRSLQRSPQRSLSPPKSLSSRPLYKSKRSVKERSESPDSPLSKSISLFHSRSKSKSPKLRKSVGPVAKSGNSLDPLARSRSPLAPPPRSRSPLTNPPRSRSPLTNPPRSRSPLTNPPRSRSPLTNPPRSRIPLDLLPKSRSPLDPPPKSRSPLEPPPKSKSPLPPLPSSKSPLPPVPSSKSPLPPLPKSKSPLPPLPRSKCPPPPLPRSRSPIKRSDEFKSSLSSFARSRSPLEPSTTSRSPVQPRLLKRSKSPEFSGYASDPKKSFTTPNQANVREEKKLASTGNLDEEAQADRIAEMLLSMKSSIVGSEIDDPHLALQALLSSKGLAEALLAAKSERYDETLEEDVELATQNIPFEDSQRFKDHFKRVSDFSNWVKAELSVAFTKFTQLFNGRPASPVLNYTRKRIDKDEERRPEFVEHPAGPSYNIYHHHSREDPLLRHPPGRGISPPPHVRRALLHFPPHPHKEPPFPLFPPSPFDPYENPLRRSLPNERDPYLRGLSNERDPYLRGLSNERDPYLRGLSNERDPYLDLRNPPRMPDPYLEADLYRSRLPDRHARPEQYLDPDPLKRVFKPKPPVEPKPLKPVRPSEPFIDPDPLKRVLPSQKAKQAKPVVIDYSHGKVEKSAENKAKEWEDDIKDLLDSSKSKSHDSLSLLNSSYSSPKRENSPPEVKPTRELPFAKSYLDRAFSKAKEKSPVRKDKKRSGSYIRKKGSRSPEHYKYKKEPSGLDSYRKKISDYSFLDKKQRMSPSRSLQRSPQRSLSPPKSLSSRPLYKSKRSVKERSESPDSPLSKSISLFHSRSKSKSPKLRKSVGPVAKSGNSLDPLARSRSPLAPPPRSRSPLTNPPRSRSPLTNPPRSRSPLTNPPRSRSPLTNPPRSRIPLDLLPKSRSPLDPPPKSRSPLEPPPKSKSPLPPLPSSKSPLPPVPSSKSPLPPLPKSKSPLPPLPRSKCPPPPLPRSRSPIKRSDEFKSSLSSFARSRSPLEPSTTSRSPVQPRLLKRSKSPEFSGYASDPKKSFTTPNQANVREEKKLASTGNLDEEAQADRIAEMLLSMKSSIVGSEIDDPHLALQALLSSKGLAEALLAAKSESTTSFEKKGTVDAKTSKQISGTSQQSRKREPPPPPPSNTSTREKITFSFQGKSSVRNVPQTFMEEDSDDED